MAGTEIAQRTPEQNLVTFIRSDAVVEQLAMVLPPTVTLDRFLRITTTAILTNPDIAKLDPHTVGRALTQAAADGLMPDGKQGAIVGRGGKAVWQPMIGGFRAILAEFGWTLKTKTVYAGDRFEWQDEPPSRLHQQVRPGGERGDIIGAYAVLSHRDGRELQMFMPWADIAKRREVATTKAVWDRWTAEMSEKTVGRAIFKIAPLAEADRERLARVFDSTEIDPDEATNSLYGSPPARQIAATPPEPQTEEHGGERQQADGAPPDPGASSAPGTDDEPDLTPEFNADEQAAIEAAANEAAIFELPSGKHIGKTLGEIAAIEGDGWFVYGLRKDDLNPVVSTAVWNFCRVYKRELYTQVLAEKEAAAA
jgi:recombination protein RecT